MQVAPSGTLRLVTRMYCGDQADGKPHAKIRLMSPPSRVHVVYRNIGYVVILEYCICRFIGILYMSFIGIRTLWLKEFVRSR